MAQNKNRRRGVQITAPTGYPVTLTEVKAQLRISHSDEDTYLNTLIAAATEYTETYTSRTLMEQTWDVYFDQFPRLDSQKIILPAPPLISVTYVHYWDQDEVEQTWDSAEYTVDTTCTKGLIYPKLDYSYPSTRFYPKSVVVRCVAGYEDSGASPEDLADGVPQTIKQAILLLIGHWFENREDTTPAIVMNKIPRGYSALLANFKIREFG